jgi:hypothetical protein
MKILATNLIDFNNWYRYGFKSFSTSLIIDLDDEKLLNNPEKLFYKIGFFEDESDVFFVEIEENIDNLSNSELLNIQIDKVKNIIPLSEKGQKYLSIKLSDFKIGQHLPEAFTKAIFLQRNHYLAEKGGEIVINSFISDYEQTLSKFGIDLKKYSVEFIKAMDKYSENIDFFPDNLTEHLIVYERSRPFPNTDEGFLYDVGSIAKLYLNISDNELKIKDQLKELNIHKYEEIEGLLSFSLFLQKKNNKGIFSALMEEYKTSDWLKKLNSDLNITIEPSETGSVNNILVLAFYLKFRYLVRNISNILDNQFYKEIRHFIIKKPQEAIIALYLTGLFFGVLKFRELYYMLNPLVFSKNNNSIKDIFKKIDLEELNIDVILSTDNIKNTELEDDQDECLNQFQKIILEEATKAGEKGIKYSDILKIIKEKTGQDFNKKKIEELAESMGIFEKISIGNGIKNNNGIKLSS